MVFILTRQDWLDFGSKAPQESASRNDSMLSIRCDPQDDVENVLQSLVEFVKQNRELKTVVLKGVRERVFRALRQGILESSSSKISKILVQEPRCSFTAISQALCDVHAQSSGGNICCIYLDTVSLDIRNSELTNLPAALNISRTFSCTLARCGLSDREAMILADALKGNSTLETLDLPDNIICGSGVEAIAEALKLNSALTRLNLDGNKGGDRGGIALGNLLRTNAVIVTLTLADNGIMDTGMTALAAALECNSSLSALNLRSNRIGLGGCLALSKALKGNSMLSSLDLTNVLMPTVGAEAMLDVLRVNSTLVCFEISRHGATPVHEYFEYRDEVTKRLQRNRALIKARKQEASLSVCDARIRSSAVVLALESFNKSRNGCFAECLFHTLRGQSNVLVGGYS